MTQADRAQPPLVPIVIGSALSFAVHGVLVYLVLFVAPGSQQTTAAASASRSVRYGLCGQRRCTVPESRQPRRDIEASPKPPPLLLQAALVPALGMKEQDPSKLPKLQTYEQKEIVKEGVNLERDNPTPEKQLKKRFRPRKAKRDRRFRSAKDLLDFVDEDPRRRPTRIKDIVGVADGEVGGSGTMVRPGNLYLKKLARAIRRYFTTSFSQDERDRLCVRVLVEQMGADGTIIEYRVLRYSQNDAYDTAAMGALQLFMPEEGGRETLPIPETDVLRYINSRGLKLYLGEEQACR